MQSPTTHHPPRQRRKGARQHLLGQLRLGRKAAGWGDTGLLAPGGRVKPFLGHIQLAVNQGTARLTRIGHKDANLLLLPPPRGATLLDWRATPADLAPFFRNPVSSTMSRPVDRPRWSTTKRRT